MPHPPFIVWATHPPPIPSFLLTYPLLPLTHLPFHHSSSSHHFSLHHPFSTPHLSHPPPIPPSPSHPPLIPSFFLTSPLPPSLPLTHPSSSHHFSYLDFCYFFKDETFRHVIKQAISSHQDNVSCFDGDTWTRSRLGTKNKASIQFIWITIC